MRVPTFLACLAAVVTLAKCDHTTPSDSPVFKKGQWTKHLQNATTCNTQGEKQWAGTVDISDARRLFYWYFDSRHDPDNDPIILWLSGGPGASSMNGLFQEAGPCYIPAKNSTPGTLSNKYSWNNRASLIFIDQPAGVGFSQVKNGTKYPTDDMDGAKDLQVFLTLLFQKAFPEKAHLPIYFGGESYAGKYVTATTRLILDSRENKPKDADTFWGNVTSLLLVSPSMQISQLWDGYYDVMCTEYRGHAFRRWNESTCSRLGDSVVTWDKEQIECAAPGGIKACRKMFDDSLWPLELIYSNETIDSHNLDIPCSEQPYCNPVRFGSMDAYLNQPHILEQLGFSPSFQWSLVGSNVSKNYNDADSYFTSTDDDVEAILDAQKRYKSQKTPIRYLHLKGSLDITFPTPGSQRIMELQSWSGAASYRAQPWREMQSLLDTKETGMWKASKGGQLTFIALDFAGHMVPMDKPQVSDLLVRQWLDGGWPHASKDDPKALP